MNQCNLVVRKHLYIQYAAFFCIGANYFQAGDIETAAKMFEKSLNSLIPESNDFIEGIVSLLYFIARGAIYPCLTFAMSLIALSMLACCLHWQGSFSENLQLWLQIRSILLRNDEVMSLLMARGKYYI